MALGEPGRTHLGTAFAIHSGRHDSTCIAGTFATWKETFKADVHQRLSITNDADRT